jgi:hypothetical protein
VWTLKLATLKFAVADESGQRMKLPIGVNRTVEHVHMFKNEHDDRLSAPHGRTE